MLVNVLKNQKVIGLSIEKSLLIWLGVHLTNTNDTQTGQNLLILKGQ